MSQPRLQDLQQLLASAFQRAEPLTERPEKHADVAHVVAGNERLTPLEQAEIYREQFWLRHRDVLYDDLPGLSHILDDDDFEAFGRAYLRACPPDSYTLSDLVARVGVFAAEYPDFPAAAAGMARDMARFEARFAEVFDGPEVPPVALDEVQAIAPDAWAGMRLQLHPQLQLLAVSWPVHDVRTAARRDEAVDLATLEQAPRWRAMWRDRNSLQVHYRPLLQAEYLLLTGLRADRTLEQAIAAASDQLPSEAQTVLGERIGAWFQRWAKHGWIVGLKPGENAGT